MSESGSDAAVEAREVSSLGYLRASDAYREEKSGEDNPAWFGPK